MEILNHKDNEKGFDLLLNWFGIVGFGILQEINI